MALLDASEEVGVGVNTENIKFMSRYQNVAQSRDMKVANVSFDGVAELRYFGTTPRNQNLIHEEIKSRLDLGNA
jgi:hypothetical protein